MISIADEAKMLIRLLLISLFMKGSHVLSDDVKDILICAPRFNGSSPQTIQCGDQEVIDIKRSIAGNYQNGQCNEEKIKSWFNNPDSRCKAYVNLFVFSDCPGNKSCVINRNAATGRRINYCGYSNVLYIQYECHKFYRNSTLVMGMDTTVTGKSIDLLSPNYPCRRIQQQYSTLCTIDPVTAQSDGDAALWITVKLLDLKCNYRLYYMRRNSQAIRSINCHNGYTHAYLEVVSVTMNNNSKWDIGYVDNGNSNGNKFWISITGLKNNNQVEMRVFCTNLANNYAYDIDCDLFPESSSSSTTTTPIVVTTSATNGTSQYVTSAANISATPIGMVTKAERESSTKDILPIAVGGVLGVLVAVGLFAVLIICLIKKRRGGNKDEESTYQRSTSAVVEPAGVYAIAEHVYEGLSTDVKTTKGENKYDNGDICKKDKADRKTREGNKEVESTSPVQSVGIYTVAGHINEGLITDEKTNNRKKNYDNVVIADNSVLYAVPVKTKKLKAEGAGKSQLEKDLLKADAITQNHNDGVIMSENELYEPCPDVDDFAEENSKHQVKYENGVSNEKKNNEEETDDDSQIMYENNELYSSSVDLAEDGTELDPTVTYENVPNDINRGSD